ncbi:MAG: hypothetical protein H6551_10945 [Chitinophagales bacterium]|nr:hypothetical protein [Chitinophagaceae bacterium]MCB9065642.1 hypothetical protein [Chitinophagales bacterium]
MKLRPVLFSVAAFLLLTSLASCTRDFICECEIVYTGRPNLPDTTINSYSITDTKKNAQKLCEENSTEFEEMGIKSVETCELY